MLANIVHRNSRVGYNSPAMKKVIQEKPLPGQKRTCLVSTVARCTEANIQSRSTRDLTPAKSLFDAMFATKDFQAVDISRFTREFIRQLTSKCRVKSAGNDSRRKYYLIYTSRRTESHLSANSVTKDFLIKED